MSNHFEVASEIAGLGGKKMFALDTQKLGWRCRDLEARRFFAVFVYQGTSVAFETGAKLAQWRTVTAGVPSSLSHSARTLRSGTC